MNYILIYSIEGAKSNTEKNFYEGLSYHLENQKLSFISIQHSRKKPARNFDLDLLNVKETIKNSSEKK